MKNVTGDILSPVTDGQKTIVCHQVNCQGVMGAGLALQVKKAFPAVFMHYRDLCRHARQPELLLGKYLLCPTDKGYSIANLFGQERYGQGVQTSYGHLYQALKALRKSNPDAVIRVPYKIGCGLGGGEWTYVLRILQDTVPDAEIWRLPSTVIFKSD